MYSSLQRLQENGDIEISVATPYLRGKEFIEETIDGVSYFAVPYGWRSNKQNQSFTHKYWRAINQKVQPDVVHIHGTEFAHGNDYIQACGASNVIVSIQGLVSVYSGYYYGGIRERILRNHITISDLLRKSTIVNGRKEYERRGKIERATISNVKHIIGRTEWDKAHVWSINPEAKYHYCGETLRESFYHNQWKYENCEPNSIFISQAGYPIKGLHKVIEALPLVLLHYPNTKLYVAGNDITCKKPWYHKTGYGLYVASQIDKYKLKDHVVFTGMLSEQQMCERFLKSNLFVCPSSIENSPNSLGEAQILGVPLLASYVGGIPDMVKSNPDCMYRFDESVMLANKICMVFEKGSNIDTFLSQKEARWRHDPQRNTNDLLMAYRKVLEEM